MITQATDSKVGASSLIDSLLAEQQRTTAVEKFAQRHTSGDLPLNAKNYRDLMPLTSPQVGEQYAFEVDLDACSGCKACVAACHNLNGLEENEFWRSVGLLHGGSTEAPAIQHVTTACHHCVEPACLHGCPVEAYEKDPTTGIVRHLDDQCIGCQYCMFKCPYDVPTYSRSKGIVRKCDMCHDRLLSGEAPACVQNCPNQAIRITLVDQQTVVEDGEANAFLPGAPEPSYTLPTTVYKSEKPLPRNLLAGDHYSVRSHHSHLPLVVMLVLTQMSVGAFVAEQLLSWLFGWGSGEAMSSLRPAHLVAALLLGFTGLAAAVFHLGRPRFAWRAMLGWKRSWLSREILAFGGFAAAASLYAGLACARVAGLKVSLSIEQALGTAAAIAGLAGVFCSVMIYADTPRPLWKFPRTALRFFATSALLGMPVALLISLIAAGFSTGLTVPRVMHEFGAPLCRLVIAVAVVKFLFEASIVLHLRDRQHTPLKRTALITTGPLGLTTLKRFFFGIIGSVIVPSVLLAEPTLSPETGFAPLFVGVAVVLMLAALLLGEFFERYLFFTAVAAPKMPGSQ